MVINAIKVESTEIKNAPGLDPIHVYFYNIDPGVGHVTITCFGNAWTAYFGAMGGQTIQKFLSGCDVGYLANKLGPVHQTKRQAVYLSKIIEAVKSALSQAEQHE